jgi:hypothetical protein
MDNLTNFIYDSCAPFIQQDLLSNIFKHPQPFILYIPVRH